MLHGMPLKDSGGHVVSDEYQWVTADVRIPQVLLDAHREGRVVFFIGAGASIPAPSNLPSFQALAESLGKESGVPYEASENGIPEPIDRFLGRLTHLQPPYEIHKRAHAIITASESRPNDLHRAIVTLSAAYGKPRIITTNFDDHLSTAAKEAEITLPDQWIGPALPLGDRISGIVYLHGCVTRDPSELVITDKDLGYAYLTEAWATQFLRKLFQEYVVVFIGYSLTDPTMRYLNLGLPSGSSRYMFTKSKSAKDPEWNRLGVQTIPFGDDYGNLLPALKEWDRLARMKRLDHRVRVNEIIAAGPTLSPMDSDYLKNRLGKTEGVDDFTSSILTKSDDLKLYWLHWLENLLDFQKIFSTSPPNDITRSLGLWFVDTFISSPELNDAAFQVLQRKGPLLIADIFDYALLNAEKLFRKDRIAGERWYTFLTTSIQGRSAPIASKMLLLPSKEETEPLNASSLRPLLRPYLKFSSFSTSSLAKPDIRTEPPHVEVAWTCYVKVLTEHVLSAVNNAPSGDPSLGNMLEASLLTAYEILSAYRGKSTWDPLGFRRSSIDPHDQDPSTHRDSIDAVIDGLREYGEKALSTHSYLPDRWWEFTHPLFQRLALNLIAKDPSRTSDDKIAWLLARTNLYESPLKRELYQVLSEATADASDNLKRELLEAVQAGPKYPDDRPNIERDRAYAKYNLLVWLTKSAPEWAEAAQALHLLQEENPDFQPRPHPDLDIQGIQVSWYEPPPGILENFTDRLNESPSEALDYLLSYKPSARQFDDPSWEDVLEMVSSCITSAKNYGIPFWDEIAKRDDLAGNEAERIYSAITKGWGKIDLSKSPSSEILQRLQAFLSDSGSAGSIGEFILDQIDACIDQDESSYTAEMRSLAQNLWRAHWNDFFYETNFDPLSSSPLYLNSWPGSLAQYWLHEVDRRWRHHRDDWTGLNRTEREAVLEMLETPSPALDAVHPALAQQLYFIYSADEEFAVKNILPLFKDSRRAEFAWNAYLYFARFDNKLLAAGLLDAVNFEWAHLDNLRDKSLRESFFSLVISILSFSDISAESRNILLRESVISMDGKHATDFAEAVVKFLARENIEASAVWDHWLGKHIANRLGGIPRRAAHSELSSWAEVVPFLEDRIPEAVDLFKGKEIGFNEDFFHADLPMDAAKAYPEELLDHFLERVRNTSSQEPLAEYRIKKLVEAVRNALGDSPSATLISAAREAGFHL